MALKAEYGCRFQKVGVVLRTVDIMTTETSNAARVHRAGHEIVALHPVSAARSVRVIGSVRSHRPAVVKLPEFAEHHTWTEANRPGIVATFDRVSRRLAGRVTLDAYVVGANVVQTDWVHDIRARGPADVFTSWTVAPFASYIPFGNRLRSDVEVHRVAAVALLAGRFTDMSVRTPFLIHHIPSRR